MAANLATLEATLDGQSNTSKFRVIDFAIGDGAQYQHLVYRLSQSGKPAMVKITAVVDNGEEERLRPVGEMLSRFGEKYRVPMKFNVVVSPKLCDLSRESLGCEPNETLAVNFNSGNGAHSNFTVKEGNGGVCCGWMGRTLTVAPAWR